MKQNNLLSIELVLENCEVINIPIKYIGYLLAENFKRVLHINNGTFSDDMICKSFVIEIFNNIDSEIEYHPFGQDKKESIIKRLSLYPDITQIEFIYEDKTEHFYIDWNDNDHNGETNVYQDIYVSDLGNIYISICKDKKLKDYFDEEDFESFNDREYIMNRKLDMNLYDPVDQEKEHKFCREDLPEFYKYVYLSIKNSNTGHSSSILAVRVPDKDSVFKFIFEPNDRNATDDNKTIIYDTWSYPSIKISNFITEEHEEDKDGFTIREIMQRYPLL